MHLEPNILKCVFLYNVSTFVIVTVLGYSCKEYEGDRLMIFQDFISNTNENSYIEACWYNNNTTRPGYKLLEDPRSLVIKQVILLPLPESSTVREVDMYDVTPQGVFGGCSNLTALYIQRINFTMASRNWLAKCTRLKELNLYYLSASEIYGVLESVGRLETLFFLNIEDGRNALKLVSSFSNGKGLQWLKQIKMSIFSPVSLEGENTTWAEVSALLTEQLAALPRLEDLTIIGFREFDFCPRGNFTSLTFKSLQKLTLSETSTSRMCIRHFRVMPQIKEMKFSANKIYEIEFRDLHSITASNCYISIRDARLIFSRNDYMDLNNSNFTINIFQIYVDCDRVGSLWLARAMQEKRVNFILPVFLLCSDKKRKLINQTCEGFKCDWVDCDGPCVCYRDATHNGIRADCRGANLTTLPSSLLSFTNLTELLAPNNSIAEIPHHLPKSLQLLDVSDNRIGLLSAEAVSTLFKSPQRRVRLAGNPVDCSCDNQPLLSALQSHRNQVDDIDDIRCIYDNTYAGKLDVSALCLWGDLADANQQESIMIIAIAVTAVVAIIALMIISGYYYRREVQIFLFARGWCLSCIQEDKLDADRYYDVFLSYCHEDEEFVLDNLLPVLDREYSVCIHNRDWCPGGMIPTQIAISVAHSRRTVVVVSKNFPQSLWGMLEFRTAYASSLEERRARVVLLVLDDVLQQARLEGDLRSYVRFNTYLQWGDPWFWHKLRFALPHRPTRPAPPPCQSAFNQHQVVVEEAEDINDVFHHDTSRRGPSPFQSALNEPQRVIEEADVINDALSCNPANQAPDPCQRARNEPQTVAEEAVNINNALPCYSARAASSKNVLNQPQAVVEQVEDNNIE